ncbi:hypothetical protein G9P44_003463 [Scheffersomyces stipitis]|nr:hypothetical protein G9P44_003463 [Scheffersomyces stipitis]
MKLLTDADVITYLNSNLTKNSLAKFQNVLIEGLKTYKQNPDKVVPPRIAQMSNNEDSDTTHLFMPCISPNEVGIKVISGGAGNNAKGLGFQGCVLVLDEITGSLNALVNAKSLTAFRTALASTSGLTKVIPYDWEEVELLPELTVFGVGAQAYWHVKLILTFYKEKITTVNILNRSLTNAEKLCDRFRVEHPDVVFNEFSYEGDKSEFTGHIRNSSIIIGCTPATSPVILNDYINQDPKYHKFISLIGSYKPHMIELDLAVIEQFKSTGTAILVDSKEHTLHEAGELIQADFDADHLIEIGELYDPDNYLPPKLFTLHANNVVVQKIVGLSIMDLSIAKCIAEDTRSGGVEVAEF